MSHVESFYYPKVWNLPPDLQRKGFAEIAVHWICSNSYLSHSLCKIQGVVDQNSLENSILSSKVDLEDCEIKTGALNQSRLKKVARGIMRTATLTVAFTVIAPIGTLWHLAHCVYYAVCRKDKKLLSTHFQSFISDLTKSYITVAFIFFKLVFKMNYFHVLLNFFRSDSKDKEIEDIVSGTDHSLLFHSLLACVIFYFDFKEKLSPLMCSILGADALYEEINFSSYASFIVRRELGLVGENGWMLTYNPSIDEVDLDKEKNFKSFFANVQLFYAYTIMDCIKNIIDNYSISLSKDQINTFSIYPEKIVPLFDSILQNPSQNLRDTQKLNEDITKLRKQLRAYKAIQKLVLHLFSEKLKHYQENFRGFVLSATQCSVYLQGPPKQIGLAIRRIEELKEKRILFSKVGLAYLKEVKQLLNIKWSEGDLTAYSRNPSLFLSYVEIHYLKKGSELSVECKKAYRQACIVLNTICGGLSFQIDHLLGARTPLSRFPLEESFVRAYFQRSKRIESRIGELQHTFESRIEELLEANKNVEVTNEAFKEFIKLISSDPEKYPQPEEILGVKLPVTQAAISKAYRKLSQKYHPDAQQNIKSNSGAQAQMYLNVINAAKDLLEARFSHSLDNSTPLLLTL